MPAALLLQAAVSCRSPTGPRTVSVTTLEAAPDVQPQWIAQAVLSGADAPLPGCKPMGPRLALLTIGSARAWDELRRQAPSLPASPDFSRGRVVGVACRIGAPLNGQWPVRVESIQVSEGAGLLKAHFEGGTFLADGTTFVEFAYMEGLNEILVVDVNGSRYVP